MYIKSACLSESKLENDVLRQDKKSCRKYGPCGVGEQAVYLNSFYLDRIYYVPFTSITRMFKRVAMSEGGFTGKGMFASIPYLVVQYDDGKEKQCQFKQEKEVDALLAQVAKQQSSIPLISEAAQARLDEERQMILERETLDPTDKEAELIKKLQREVDFLEEKPTLYRDLSQAAKRKRTYQHTSPSYRWVAMTITVLGIAALIYGAWALIHREAFAMYFALFGFAAIFLFSGFSVLPTARNNKRSIWKYYDHALHDMEGYVSHRRTFPLPIYYAHPIVLKRMQRVIGKHRAETVDQALEIVKEDLKALTPEVEVDQAEYDEVVAIKPLFTVVDYQY